MSVFRIYVEKKPSFAVEAQHLLADLKTSLRLNNITNIAIANRYDVQGLSQEHFDRSISTVFSEPTVDNVYYELPEPIPQQHVFAVEYLAGQFDQRADSCSQCIQLLNGCECPTVRNARVYFVTGDISENDINRIKEHLINPVESKEASLDVVDTLDMAFETKTTVETFDNFNDMSESELSEFIKQYGLAMDNQDILFCQKYFKEQEKRNPTITEIKMIDTYWSDHCRHTTFLTNIDNVEIEQDYIKAVYDKYINAREVLYQGRTDKPITLMDLAIIGAKQLKADGVLTDLDESEEINACSVKIKVCVDGSEEDWLLMFKNETHNHPTEIEPFGGAATCLGGAIRDPLSGRSYVYQAMRVTGASNPLVDIDTNIKGKLPQRKIVNGAANGYSSYGNQIGLATGHVAEVYHDGYVAKRMEIGAVIGATPAKNVVREVPTAGDIVVLLGGRTGRDGCGGATGSSKSHTLDSLETCGAEVQKGNAPIERKIQRLFRNPNATVLIKRCNDFGAGGISVAIGELADGLEINLDVVPKKYNGLDGTELAISESQERMAVVISPENVDKFILFATHENLEATQVATVTEQPRLTMNWCGNKIVDLSREFLNSNGAVKHTDIKITAPTLSPIYNRKLQATDVTEHMCELNICCKKGLVERFDSTIGAGTVLMPFGGESQLSPTQAMVAKIPLLTGNTDDCSVMGYGMNPDILEQSPFHGAMYAVIESVAKVVAVGGDYKKCWLSFQEYFERTNNDPQRWGKPMAALLGAYEAQMQLGIASIGGKDSMSGSFEDIDVPPTLCSFAVSMAKASKVISPEFKSHSNYICLVLPEYDQNGIPNFDSIKASFDTVQELIQNSKINACWALSTGGVIEGMLKMGFGNLIGAKITDKINEDILFNPIYGGFIVATTEKSIASKLLCIGSTISKYSLVCPSHEMINLHNVQRAYQNVLEPVFPYQSEPTSAVGTTAYNYRHDLGQRSSPLIKISKPNVVIPAFPGTNCEEDSRRAFEQAGAQTDIVVVRNLTPAMIENSVMRLADTISNSQILMLPGGFSGGDEPDGSAKFIVSLLKNPRIQDAISDLLENRDGLILGICNGFQALIKLGLVPYGKIVDVTENDPTLTFNQIGRHQSMVATTRITSNKSPWLNHCKVGDIHSVPISHGEGRFVADTSTLNQLSKNGQIATQYVDLQGRPSENVAYNPNGSVMAIEGITSPDGRVFGKMGHSERVGENICKNIVGEKDQLIFKSGVEYFH